MAVLDELLLLHGRTVETSDPEWQPVDFAGTRTWQTIESLAYVLSEFQAVAATAVTLEAVRPTTQNATPTA
jgi:hypothetical protein